jgi:hypothetical protein
MVAALDFILEFGRVRDGNFPNLLQIGMLGKLTSAERASIQPFRQYHRDRTIQKFFCQKILVTEEELSVLKIKGESHAFPQVNPMP